VDLLHYGTIKPQVKGVHVFAVCSFLLFNQRDRIPCFIVNLSVWLAAGQLNKMIRISDRTIRPVA